MRFTILMMVAMLFIAGSMSLFLEGTEGQWIQDGEPLNLWFKRSPAQDSTTLVFHEPSLTEDQLDDPKFRHSLGPRGGNTSKMVLFFPTDKNSNFLQFEYNDTLEGNFSITLSAILPQNASTIQFQIKINIEMDLDRDGDYDEEISFDVTGDADSTRRTYEGEIPKDQGIPERFDGQRGGRIRITIERKDLLDTNVLIYCGYKGFQSSFNLPFSKYTYVAPEPEDNEIPVSWIIGIGSAFIILVVFIVVILMRKQEEEPEPEEPKKRKGSKRRRR